MTFQQLYYLSEAARLGSINKAAQALFVSQSAISNSIIDLETEFRLKILERSASGVSLTTEGAEFLTHARSIITQTEYLQERYNHAESTDMKQLTISSAHISFCTQTFIQMMQSLKENDFRVTLKETSPEALLGDILDNRSDLGVLFMTDVIKRHMDSFAGDRVKFHELCKLQSRVCVRRGHPLTQLSQVRRQDLKPYPYLVMNHGKIPPVEHGGEGRFTLGGHPTQIVYANDRGSIDDILASTDAYHICCGMDSPRNVQDLCLLPVADSRKKVRLGWVSLRDKTLSPEGRCFVDLLKSTVKHWMETSNVEQIHN